MPVGRVLKRLLFGRPLASEEAGHQLLPKLVALPVFASDALSSNAYATEEIMHVLILAGIAALSWSLPIAFAVSVLMVIVVTSYRQTVRAYPRGGGSYIVTRENVGTIPSLVAAASIQIAYVLTAAVSMAAGAYAVASLVPDLNDHRVAMALSFLAVIMLMNLRGTKESGTLFAVPTYAFIASIFVMIVIGVAKCTIGTCPRADVSGGHAAAVQSIGIFLILRAFSSGATALTGVEAIADGVAAFRGRKPADQAENAATTLSMLAVISISMFIGITFLANQMHARPTGDKSVVAQVADATFGGGVGFVVVQITTALILILAANTAYQDFPRLSSILARDRFMPRQFINRGDRLVFSNGILVLSALAGLLVVIYDADVTRLIPLYVGGVFLTFTLSQTGMVIRWRRLQPQGWRRMAAMNAAGAITTGIVFIVVVSTKFTEGAWIMVVSVPLIVLLFRGINKHYASVAAQLRAGEVHQPLPVGTRALVLVGVVDEAAMRALGYARALRPLEVRALVIARSPEVAQAAMAEWTTRGLRVPLDIVEADDDKTDAIRTHIHGIRQDADEFVTLVIPERLRRTGFGRLFRQRYELMLKASMLFEPQVVVTDVPTIVDEGPGRTDVSGPIAPARNVAIVLISAVHNATLRALTYAKAIRPTEIRAVMFNVEDEQTRDVMEDWSRTSIDIPLEIVDSPYREVAEPLVRMVRQIRAGAPDTVVTVILPEFVVSKWYHQFLHNQTALAIKRVMLYEPGVVVTSVPYHLI
jgi:amino acid transporter